MICFMKRVKIGNIYCFGDTWFKCLKCKLRRVKGKIQILEE